MSCMTVYKFNVVDFTTLPFLPYWKFISFPAVYQTPRKGFGSSTLPVAQTPPNKDIPPGKDTSPGNAVLTPEQVGHLARLIQMYQKDKHDGDLPSPDRMFQYLRDVQTRWELFNLECIWDFLFNPTFCLYSHPEQFELFTWYLGKFLE